MCVSFWIATVGDQAKEQDLPRKGTDYSVNKEITTIIQKGGQKFEGEQGVASERVWRNEWEWKHDVIIVLSQK